jgi:hypothetical protein
MNATMKVSVSASALLGALLLAATARAEADEPGERLRPVELPFRLAVQTEAAAGVATGAFYNQLVGVRLDIEFSPHVAFGGYLGYVNLKGKDGRASDVLPYAQVEYRTGAPGDPVRIPLRFASGYLPHNGPVARLAAGLAFSLTPRVDLVTELLAPMLWVTNDQVLLSMNFSLELAFRL